VSYLGDDLYANQPLCQLIAEIYRQFFIFVCKPESHTSLSEWVDFLEKTGGVEKVTQRHWNGKHGEIWQYRFAQQVPLCSDHEALRVNWFELVIAHETTGESLYHNSFVTNHAITAANVIPLARVGRTRWKIENNNNLKTKGYHLEHNFGHGQQD
jgi:SRSO17 transposase